MTEPTHAGACPRRSLLLALRKCLGLPHPTVPTLSRFGMMGVDEMTGVKIAKIGNLAINEDREFLAVSFPDSEAKACDRMVLFHKVEGGTAALVVEPYKVSPEAPLCLASFEQRSLYEFDADHRIVHRLVPQGDLDRMATKAAWDEIEAAMVEAGPTALRWRRYTKVAKSMADLWVVPAL